MTAKVTRTIEGLAMHVRREILTLGPDRVRRASLDIWSASGLWESTGRAVVEISERSPAISADLVLAAAPVTRESALYLVDDWWMLLARTPPGLVMPVGEGVSYRMSDARLLLYVTRVANTACAGYINLSDQPTPRYLNLLAGRSLDGADIAPEAIRLAMVLPWFFMPTP